jgi:hypothetical protein
MCSNLEPPGGGCEALELEFIRGNPWVKKVYPYPYPFKPLPLRRVRSRVGRSMLKPQTRARSKPHARPSGPHMWPRPSAGIWAHVRRGSAVKQCPNSRRRVRERSPVRQMRWPQVGSESWGHCRAEWEEAPPAWQQKFFEVCCSSCSCSCSGYKKVAKLVGMDYCTLRTRENDIQSVRDQPLPSCSEVSMLDQPSFHRSGKGEKPA